MNARPSSDANSRLQRLDAAILLAVCLPLFGICLISGRPLSIHEAVLPQSTRAMLADGDFLVPKNGEGPWLESPPLPQWISVGLASLFGHADSLMVARLGNVLVATAIVLMVAAMGARLFGRAHGVAAGLILATMAQFTRYAWLAEDEIYLCGLVTAAVWQFVRLEFPQTHEVADAPPQSLVAMLIGRRSSGMVLLFALVGLTNLVKGLIFGAAMATIPIIAFLLLTRDWPRISRYAWVWGVGIVVAIAAAWPLLVWQRYPDVVDLWFFDLGGRVNGAYGAINEPVWYYPVNLVWMLAPWVVFMPSAFWVTRRMAWQQAGSPERLLWCWALCVPLVFTIPSGKHHHYLLHALAPWALLAPFGLSVAYAWYRSWSRTWRHPAWSLATIATPLIVVAWLSVRGDRAPMWLLPVMALAAPTLGITLAMGSQSRSPHRALGTLVGVFVVCFCFGHLYAGWHVDRWRADVALLKSLRAAPPADAPVYVDLGAGSHRGMLAQFYLAERGQPLQNASYLLDARIASPAVCVLSSPLYAPLLERYGQTEVLAQSAAEPMAGERLTLYRVTLDAHRQPVAAEKARISPMQAILRAEGPDLNQWR